MNSKIPDIHIGKLHKPILKVKPAKEYVLMEKNKTNYIQSSLSNCFVCHFCIMTNVFIIN